MSLSIDARVDSLVSALTLAEKATRMYSCVDQCDTCPCPVDRLGLPPFAYLLEANTGVAAKCLGPGRCATIFPGPLGMGGSFNRSVFRAKGRVLGREVRAFNNFQGTRNLGPMTGLAAFGPNINVARGARARARSRTACCAAIFVRPRLTFECCPRTHAHRPTIRQNQRAARRRSFLERPSRSRLHAWDPREGPCGPPACRSLSQALYRLQSRDKPRPRYLRNL